LRAVVESLAGSKAVGLDTESDSLHHYREKVCLVQIAGEAGTAYLVDPLAFGDLSALAPICADPGVVKIFHGADYDITCLKRDFHFQFSSLFDTMVAARFLGLAEVGLDALLLRYFQVLPGKSRQRDDWSQRPLSPAQEAYAITDVKYLIPLREKLLAELNAVGRAAWVLQECEGVAALPAAGRVFDPDGFLWSKGARQLDGRQLAILRELYRARERWAEAADRPVFKVLGNETLIHLALDRPRTPEALLRIRGCTPYVLRNYGEGIFEAIRRGEAAPDSDLPAYPPPPKRFVPGIVQRRGERLKAWRAAAAPRLGLDPGVFLPQRLIDRLAEEGPADLEALARVDGFRRWRAHAFGQEILACMPDPPGAPRAPRRRRRHAGR
jgi:ribonuclease D